MCHCQPRVKCLAEISQSPSAETLGVIWRIMISMISDGAKSGTELEEKHWARFLPFNIPLKGNLAWNPWHVWWNSTAPCVQWNSPQLWTVGVCACGCLYWMCACMCLYEACEWYMSACACASVWVLSSQQKCSFPLSKSTLSISCHVWLPSVVTDNTVGSDCSQLAH